MLLQLAGQDMPHSPLLRGLRGLYRPDETNRCPGCARMHWIVGRFSAECAFCATALPLEGTDMLGAGTYVRSSSRAAPGEWDLCR